MTEKEPHQESLAEQTIRRYRSPESLQHTEKRKKLSTIIFLVNIVMIVILYMFYAGGKKEDEYRSSSFNYKDLQFRFSLLKEQATGNYIFSLTTKSASGGESVARFNNGIADLIISHGSTVLVTLPVGKGKTSLPLKPGEMDLQKTVIDRAEMKVYTDGHPEYVVTPRGSIFGSERAYIPLTAEVRIHADQPVSTALQFKYEVEQ